MWVGWSVYLSLQAEILEPLPGPAAPLSVVQPSTKSRRNMGRDRVELGTAPSYYSFTSAEGVGFEPTIRLDVYRCFKPVPSTTRATPPGWWSIEAMLDERSVRFTSPYR